MRFDQQTISYGYLPHVKNNPARFIFRANQLKKLQSYHIVKVQAIQKQMKIKYQGYFSDSFDRIIQQKSQLLSSQIKSIIWQFTKAMLQCQKHKINHLRLYPKSIRLLKKQKHQKNSIFLKIHDFSFGKEFADVSQGKKLQFFEYLHPDISIKNKNFSFEQYNASWDIWSFGIILYYLIYQLNPFRKKNSDKFSKTILRQYLQNEYYILYPHKKYKSINKFIQKCLNIKQQQKFTDWYTVRSYLIEQQQTYNALDFHDGNFLYLVQLHVKLMTLFSCIYCMVIQECKHNPNPFWKIGQNKHPLHLKVQEFTLILMNYINIRFHEMYASYFQLAKGKKQELQSISKSISNQLQFKDGKWVQESFSDAKFTLKTVNTIDDICQLMKTQINTYGVITEYKGSDIEFDLQSSDIYPASYQFRQQMLQDTQIINSMAIIFDYCKNFEDKNENYSLKLLYQSNFKIFALQKVQLYKPTQYNAVNIIK